MILKNILTKRNRVLLRELVVTDFKLRYQGSVLGYLWSLLKPLFLFAILYVVFGHFLKVGGDVEHFSVYLLTGIVMWTFFTEATTQGLQAIVSRGDLIRKINFPKYIIIVSGTTSALINLIFNLFIVMVFILLNGVKISLLFLLAPVIILELYVFALGLAFFLSALNVKFRDIGYLWEVTLQAAFYATPILYPISVVLDKSQIIAKLLLLNPVAQCVQDLRYVLVTHQTVTAWSISGGMIGVGSIFIVLFILLLATMYFRKSSKYFAEYV